MQAYILDALRTPVVPSGRELNSLLLRHLAVPVVKSLLKRQNISPLLIEQFVMGNALNAGGNPARVVSLNAGLSESAMACTIDTNCNSGIDAIIMGAEKIRAGSADIIIAGGAESVSRSPIRAYRPIDKSCEPIKYRRPAFTPWHGADPSMEESAERNAIDGEITEKMQRDWLRKSIDKAVGSHEVLNVEKVHFTDFSKDEYDLDIGQEQLSCDLEDSKKLSSSISESVSKAGCLKAPTADAAAFVILVSERWLKKNDRQASVQLVDSKTMGSAADDPSWAIIDSCRAIMQKNEVSPNSFSSIEMVETHAAQILYCMKELGFDKQLVNPAGGDLARGNALAASSAVLLVRLFHDLKAKSNGELGLAASAASGGIGSAVIMQAC